MMAKEKITVENVNVPGYTARVDAVKYKAMRKIILKITPKGAPGLTAAAMFENIRPLLPQELWPSGEKAGWWQKTVQLDLEAKGLLVRDSRSKPLRWYRSG